MLATLKNTRGDFGFQQVGPGIINGVLIHRGGKMNKSLRL